MGRWCSRAESACNVRFTWFDAPTNAAAIKRRDVLSHRRDYTCDRRRFLGGFLGVAVRRACDRSVVKGARIEGRRREERTERRARCSSVVAAYLLVRPSLTEMHDRRWWLTSVARDHYGGNKTLRRRKRLDDRNGIYIHNVTFESKGWISENPFVQDQNSN